MKKRNIQPPKWLLTSKEEQQLTEKDKEKYYEKLREYCLSRKFTNTTIGVGFTKELVEGRMYRDKADRELLAVKSDLEKIKNTMAGVIINDFKRESFKTNKI